AVAGAAQVERAGGAADQVAPGGAAVGRLLPLVGERDRVAVVVVLGDGRGQQVVGLRRALVDRGRVDDRRRVDDRDRGRGDGGAVDGAVVRGHLDPQLVALGAVAGAGEEIGRASCRDRVAPGGAAVGRLLPLVGERDRVAVVVVLGDGRGQQVVRVRGGMLDRGVAGVQTCALQRYRGRGDGGAVDGAVVRGHLDPQLVALGAVAGAGE